MGRQEEEGSEQAVAQLAGAGPPFGRLGSSPSSLPPKHMPRLSWPGFSPVKWGLRPAARGFRGHVTPPPGLAHGTCSASVAPMGTMVQEQEDQDRCPPPSPGHNAGPMARTQ